MPAINQQVSSLQEVELGPDFRPELLIIDADDTAFPHGSPQPYEDLFTLLDRIEPQILAIVSGNPDASLAFQRKNNSGADIVARPRFPNIDKRGLIDYVLREVVDVNPVETALVIGNRWFNDVVVPRTVLFKNGVKNMGVHVQREGAQANALDKAILHPIELTGSAILKLVGIDHYVRPQKSTG